MNKSPNLRNSPNVRIARPAGRAFQIRYTCPISKQEIRISVGSRDESSAKKMKAETEAKLLLGLEVQKKLETVFGPEMAWEEFREKYRVLHLSTLREGSAIHYENRMDIAERIIKPKTLGQMAQTSNLQQLQIRLYQGELSKRNASRSPHTVRGYMRAILVALNWAYQQDWLLQKPKLKMMKASKQKAMKGRPITEVEFKKMLEVTQEIVGNEAADSWHYVLRGLWESSLRIDELMHVSWDLSNTIRPIWTQKEFPVLEIPAPLQKNDTHEIIPLLPGFESLLLETGEADRKGWAFNPQSLRVQYGGTGHKTRPKAEWIGKVISKIGRRAGIVVNDANPVTGCPVKFASAHDLRRSCGERMRNAGVDPLVICRVMRHSSWDTTRKHYAPGNIQADAATLRGKIAR